MGRIRTIKPEFPQSESIGKLSREARLLFLQLFTIVDDAGRARAASRMLASLLYPYDDDAPSLIEKWLCELENQGMIMRYVVSGSKYLVIPTWLEHQKIDKPSLSKLPEPVINSPNARECSEKPPETSGTDMDLGPRIKEEEKDSEAYASGAIAPLSSADQSAEIILDARTRLFREGLALLAHMTGKPPDKCRSFLGKVLKDMGDDCPAAFAVIEAAANARPADPVSWIAAAVQERKKPAQPAKKTNKLRPGIDYDPRYFFPNTREQIAALPPPKPDTREYESWQCCGLGYPPSDPPGTPRSFIM